MRAAFFFIARVLSEDTISVDPYDGRTITAPLAWSPRLLHATPGQRANWRVAGAGYGIHRPDIDEDLSAQGLLQGSPAPKAAAGERHQPHPVAVLQLPRGPFIAPQEPLVVHHHPDWHAKAFVVPLDIG
jgi:hypothetical protein